MNWVDGILLVMLLAMVIVGSKKGMIRELTAFIIFFVAIIVSVNYVDRFAVWVARNTGGSPLLSAFLSFAVLLALCYVVFKLLGLLFYKVAQIKSSGKRDQMGGALVGFLRGWVLIGFITFMAFLLPLPQAFYTSFETSFFGPVVAKTVPLMFETTAPIHPENRDFIDKIETTLLLTQSQNGGHDISDEDRKAVLQVMNQMRKFFKTGLDGT